MPGSRTKAPPPQLADEETLSGALEPPDSGELIQRPDGWYWLADGGNQQFGPFETAADAQADMSAAAEEEFEPGETLEEAEDELGVAAWVDPDTGELAEETHARIEDH